MSIEKILAISGKPGLYELKLQTRSGFIAESLVDGKKLTVGLKSNVSLLSEISIYTHSGEVKLFEVFARIAKKENNGEAISHKTDNNELVTYFSQIIPDYDTDRVYISDIKKVFNWYNIIQKAGFVAQLNIPAPKESSEEVKATEVQEKADKSVAKTKKSAEVSAEAKPKAKRTTKAEDKTETAEEKPKAKRTVKKKEE